MYKSITCVLFFFIFYIINEKKKIIKPLLTRYLIFYFEISINNNAPFITPFTNIEVLSD